MERSVIAPANHQTPSSSTSQPRGSLFKVTYRFVAPVIVGQGALLSFLPPGNRAEALQAPRFFQGTQSRIEEVVYGESGKESSPYIRNYANTGIGDREGGQFETPKGRYVLFYFEWRRLIPDPWALKRPEPGTPCHLTQERSLNERSNQIGLLLRIQLEMRFPYISHFDLPVGILQLDGRGRMRRGDK